jgi:tRNA dimethylallyltransferase
MRDVFCEADEIARIICGIAIEAKKKIPEQFQRKKKRVIVISGPTCCGKSSLAMTLAQAMDGEIISGDSMHVYTGMDIGTAKPTQSDRLLIPHHLIDIRDVTESYNVVDFYYDAHKACQSILDRGGTPIVVGGSGFYLHTLIYGPPSGPPSLPELRKSLEDEIEELGSDVLYARLQKQDPQYAKTITKNDKQKIVRALEIMTLTRTKVSQLSWKERRQPPTFDFHCWFLHRPKDILYKRIEDRCDRMVAEGFMDEVRDLELRGIRNNNSATQAIGYRQALEYLSSSKTPVDYENFERLFKQATRHYAKRQFTWFKKEPLYRWLDVEMHDPEVVFDIIRKDYEIL